MSVVFRRPSYEGVLSITSYKKQAVAMRIDCS